jgi:hypothetical protein
MNEEGPAKGSKFGDDLVREVSGCVLDNLARGSSEISAPLDDITEPLALAFGESIHQKRTILEVEIASIKRLAGS